MSVRMRLQRHGRKKKPFYHIVIADARAPRDGKFIERLGFYNPNTNPATIELDTERSLDWLHKGAQPTNTVKAILSYTGVLYRKHLQRGVSKGAFSQEVADQKFVEWLEQKRNTIDGKKAGLDQEKADKIAQQENAEREKRLANRPKEEPKPKAEVVQAEAPKPEPKAEAPKAEAPKPEPKAEAPKPEPKAEAPKPEPKAEAPKPEPKAEAPKPEPKVEAPKPEPKAEAPKPEPVVEVKEVVVEQKEATVVEKIVETTPLSTIAHSIPVGQGDDLKMIEGIGPKIEEALYNAGINTWEKLSQTPAEKVKEVLDAAEGNFGSHDPTTWPKQAEMAHNGDWGDLKEWQDKLDGGKVV